MNPGEKSLFKIFGARLLIAQEPAAPADRATLEQLVDQLEDPATDLVRRDSNFKKLGLTDSTAERHDESLQRRSQELGR